MPAPDPWMRASTTCRPAGVTRQLIGVFSAQWLEPIAQVLNNLGTEHAWVVHGTDGLDEITVTGPTDVCELKQGKIRRFQVSPDDLGLSLSTAADIRGGDPASNADAIRALFDGKAGAYRDIVVMNAAAALVVAGAAEDFKAGGRLAAEAIDDGRARAKLDQLIEFTTMAETES